MYVCMYVCVYICLCIYIVCVRRDSVNKTAEFSQVVSAMVCPQEQRFFINIYRCLQI